MRLIDADAIEYTHAIARSLEDGHNWNELCVTEDEIKDMPTIEAEPVRHGHWNGWTATHWTWKYDDNGDPIYAKHTYYSCSGCRRRTIIKSAYCPACGCKMDEVIE